MESMAVKLNRAQINRISEISGNASLVFFASMVLPGLINLPEANVFEIIVGSLLGLGCAFASIDLLKKIKV